MGYATKADMIAMFGDAEIVQITDRANINVLNDAVLNTALGDASSEADAYLPVVPTTASRALVRHVAAIARFMLWKDRASQEVRDRYDDAIAWLKLAAKGTVKYGDLPVSVTAQPGVPQSKSLVLNHEQYQVKRLGFPALWRGL